MGPDGLGNVDRGRTKDAFCDCCQSARKAFSASVPGVDISRPTGYEWWKAIPGRWPQGGAGEEPASRTIVRSIRRQTSKPRWFNWRRAGSRLGARKAACGVAAGKYHSSRDHDHRILLRHDRCGSRDPDAKSRYSVLNVPAPTNCGKWISRVRSAWGAPVGVCVS